MPRSRLGIFHNERIRTTPVDPKLTIWSVSYYFGEFGTVWLPYETRGKTGRTSAKVRAMKSRRNFCKERTQSTSLDPKLTFLCISYYLGEFGTVWLPYETLYITGELVPMFVPGCRVGILRNEHTRSTTLDPKLTFWCVSNNLGASGTIWLLYKTRCQTGRTSAKVRAMK